MGAGNYLPPKDETYPHIYEEAWVKCDPVYEMVYIDLPYSTSRDCDLWDDFERGLIGKIDRFLPGSFYQPNKRSWEWQNGVLKVCLKSEYNGYYPLFFTPRNPLGIPHIDRVSRRVFDALVDAGYILYRRGGPYSCSIYTQILSSAGKSIEVTYA